MSAILETNNEYLRCKGGLINHCLSCYRNSSQRYESSMSRCLPNTKYGEKITRNNIKIHMKWPCKYRKLGDNWKRNILTLVAKDEV